MPSSDDPLSEARKLPIGAGFYRCALQVNPHHYAETFRGQPGNGDADVYAKAVVEKARQLHIEVLAITDHNDASSVPAFKRAAAGCNLHVFPGFELSSQEGVHVLCIYPEDTEQQKLERFLGVFDITSTTPSSDSSNKDFVSILRCVREQGGVAIAAHVTNKKGLFDVLRGQACVRAWQSEELLAIQIPGSVNDLPLSVRQIVENKNRDYSRDNAVEENLALAAINARDVAGPEDLDDPAASCWIKMSEVSIDGLKQAFLDPGSRIRLNPKEGEEHAKLIALTWEGGFLDKAAIHFNPNLNVLVGGRGTGKSTIIESIRSVLAIEPVGEDAHKAHESVVRDVLRNGTKISLLVSASRPTVRKYRIERTIPNPPVVKDEQGQISNLSPRDVLPGLEVYGQHEISELTKSPEKLTRLLDRFVERDAGIVQRKAGLQRDLEKSRRSLLEARAEMRSIEDRLAALPGLEETLERFREAGLEERLREQSLVVREERVLASIPDRLAPHREALEILERELPIDCTFISPKALEELPGREILGRANPVFEQLGHDLAHVTSTLKEALARADQGIAAVHADWDARKKSVQDAYERILRDLQKSRVDGEEFIRLRRQIEELRPLRDRLSLLQKLEKEQVERRRALLDEWEDLKGQEFRRLDRAAKEVSKKLKDKVQVAVTAAGIREPLTKILRENIGGRLVEAIECLEGAPDLSLPALVDAWRAGATALSNKFGIPAGRAEWLAKAEPEVLMRIEESELPPTTTVKLNTAPEGDPPSWKALNDLSTGQKATAVLLLLLLESDAPLIVDQPEDDLDNRFITEGVVPRMRQEKQRRQFVFSTHNANIPVLGDAELIVGLSASDKSAHLDRRHMGSIDDKPVRELVEEILEGGKDAFERRRRKYGF